MLKKLTIHVKIKRRVREIKPATIAIILIVIIAAVLVVASLNLDLKVGQLNVYSGRIKANFLQVKRIDGTSYAVADSQMRVIHGSLDYNDQVAAVSGASVTGEMKEADKGVWYLIIDYGTNNTLWIDTSETLNDPYVTRVFGFDGDKDGFQEDCVELNFGSLSPLVAGEDKKEVDVKLVYDPARTSAISFSLQTNSSGISTTGYSYETVTGYTAGFTEGDLAKIAKIEIDFSDNATRATWPDSSYFMLVHLKIGPYTFTPSQFGTYDLSNKRYQTRIGDQINHQGGKDLFYAKNAGDLWAIFELKAYCKFPEGGQELLVTLKFYFYKPDGTITSAVTVNTWFAS
jgi:hypothetical protein